MRRRRKTKMTKIWIFFVCLDELPTCLCEFFRAKFHVRRRIIRIIEITSLVFKLLTNSANNIKIQTIRIIINVRKKKYSIRIQSIIISKYYVTYICNHNNNNN